MKKTWIALLSMIFFTTLSACGNNTKPIMTIEVEGFGTMKVELDPTIAPNTVNNMIQAIEEGYYDGLTFHRIIEGFMIQGGRGPYHGCTIRGEFSSNGFENPLKHERGVISMARTNHPNSAGRQFFIIHEASPHLDGDYAAFGRLIEGFDVLDAIAAVDINAADNHSPIEPVVITRVSVKTHGRTFDPPVCG